MRILQTDARRFNSRLRKEVETIARHGHARESFLIRYDNSVDRLFEQANATMQESVRIPTVDAEKDTFSYHDYATAVSRTMPYSRI